MIKGFLGTTLIDYPKNIASIIFFGGCNFLCPFCYNKRLVLKEYLEKDKSIPEKKIVSQLIKRKDFIDGVVITGGEPLINNQTVPLLQKIKEKTSLKIKLDTNGTSPEKLKEIIDNHLVDYIALDIKTSFSNYNKLCNISDIKEKLLNSMSIIRNGKLDYEWRTTVLKSFFLENDIIEISNYLEKNDKYFLQNFVFSKEIIAQEKLQITEEKCNENYELDELKKIILPILKKTQKVYFRGF